MVNQECPTEEVVACESLIDSQRLRDTNRSYQEPTRGEREEEE